MQSGSLWGGLENIKLLISGHEWCLSTQRSNMELVDSEVSRMIGVCDGWWLGKACS
jgi:hypothetical protein